MTPRFIRTPTGIIRYDNNFTDIEKIKLENIENGAQVNTILGIKGSNEDNFRIGYIIITKDNIGLGSVDNTPDNEKNVLSATKLTTGRNITIGNQTVNFDGSKNIEYSLSKIGAVNKAGDTITGDIILSDGAGLTVDGAVLLKSTLSVDEKTMLKDILEVSGATTLKDTLAVTGNTTIGGTISVTGDSTLSNLNITGNNTIGGTLEVTGKTTLNNELVSNGATTLKDTLAVTGNTTIGGAISVTGNSTLNGTLTVTGNSSLSTLTTSGLATLNELNVAKGANILGNAAIRGGLAVTGNSSFSTISTSGKATLNSLEVVGALSIGSDLSISGALTVAGKTTLNGYTTINNRLEVSDNITATSLTINAEDFGPLIPAVVINGNLSVTKVGAETVSAHKVIADESFELSMGEANFIGNVNIDGITDINTLQVSESAEFNCSVNMYGSVIIEGNLKVNADADLKNLNVTDETIVNTLKVNSNAVVDGEYLKVRGNLIIESGDASIDYNLTVGQTITTKNLTVSNVLTNNNVIALATNKYTDQYNYGAMDAGNSNIYNVNQIQFGDLCENAAEGIQFYNTSTTVDSLWAKSGVLYFTPKRAWGTSGTNTVVLTSDNLKNYTLTSTGGTLTGPLVLKGATSAVMNNTTTNPRIIFSSSESGNGQQVGIVYTNYDSYRASKGLKIMDVDGNDSGNVWLEVQGKVYSPEFVENGTALSSKYLGKTATAASLNYFTTTSFTNVGLEISQNVIGYVNGLSANPAGDSAKDGALIGQRYSDIWKAEIYMDYRTGHMATRGKNNGTWYPWQVQLDSGNYTKYAAAKNHTHTKSQITDFPTSMPASDVPAWAKASTKPTYTASEVSAVPISGGTVNGAITFGKNDAYGIRTNTNNYGRIGDATNQFYEVYANTIYENKIKLSEKYAAKSHTHDYAAKSHTHDYAAKSHTHEYIVNSDGKCKLYFNNQNEVNFGGTDTTKEIYFGFRATDSRPKPSTFYLGPVQTIDFGSNGSSTVGTANLCCNSIYCKDILVPSIILDGRVVNKFKMAWRHADTKMGVGDLSYTDPTESSERAPTISTLAFWNGRYNTYHSNLRFCWGGQMTYSPDGAITCFRAGSTYLEVTANGVAYGCNWWQSDTKLKTNIEETNVNDALTKLSSIDFIQYDWKESYIKDRPHIKLGLSANQVETIIPEAVINIEQPEENEYDVIKQLDSTVLITYSMKAIVELNNKLNDKVEKLEKRIKELETAKN